MTATFPAGRFTQRWSPAAASGSGERSAPARTMARAPSAPSSPGWKQSRTRPRAGGFAASRSAAPRRMAVWPSWPQACMTPGFTLP